MAFITVTTDPKRDTPEVMAAYSKKLRLVSTLGIFLAAHLKDVQAVWANYGIGVTIEPKHRGGSQGKRRKWASTDLTRKSRGMRRNLQVAVRWSAIEKSSSTGLSRGRA